jgi:hypothetical protein
VLFAVYGFSGDGRRNPLVVRIGPLFALSCAANVTWLFLWHWERFGLSMIVMLVLLGSLIGISGWGLRDVEQRGQPGVFELIAVWATFSVYLSWISVATLANAAVTVDRGRWDAMGVSDVNRATLMVVAAAALALAFVAHGDLPYGLVFIAAAAGIATRQSDAEWLAFASWTAAALVAVATIIRVVRPSASAEPGGRRLLPVG